MCKDINVNSNKDIKCKYCSNEDNIVKCGFSNLGKQRYKCRVCGKTFIEGEDKRIKHSIEERKICLLFYLSGMSMRGIQKNLKILFNKNIYFESISYWIKNSNKILEEELKDECNKKDSNKKDSNNKDNKKGLVIMEMDELYTYIKKNPKIIMENHIFIKEYGLLLIGKQVYQGYKFTQYH